jgi:hypothetical protein
VLKPGDILAAPEEGLIRRGRHSKKQTFIIDQITKKIRPPAAVFEPRLPETRPNAQKFDKYLSVNILSSLTAANLPRDWNGNTSEFYSVQVQVADCHALSLTVAWLPIEGSDDPALDNPHHGGIDGIVQLFYADRDAYEVALSRLARAAEVLPECIS